MLLFTFHHCELFIYIGLDILHLEKSKQTWNCPSRWEENFVETWDINWFPTEAVSFFNKQFIIWSLYFVWWKWHFHIKIEQSQQLSGLEISTTHQLRLKPSMTLNPSAISTLLTQSPLSKIKRGVLLSYTLFNKVQHVTSPLTCCRITLNVQLNILWRSDRFEGIIS